MQPVSGYNYYVIPDGVGTYVLTDRASKLYGVAIPGTYVGTMKVYDSATAAGTAATNLLLSKGIPATVLSQNILFEAQCKKGIVVEATGTPLATIMWA